MSSCFRNPREVVIEAAIAELDPFASVMQLRADYPTTQTMVTAAMIQTVEAAAVEVETKRRNVLILS